MIVLQFKQVFDLKDDEQLKDLISRVAARLVILGSDELVANPIAIQMISGYMQYLYDKICRENNITIEHHVEGGSDEEFFNIHKETEH